MIWNCLRGYRMPKKENAIFSIEKIAFLLNTIK